MTAFRRNGKWVAKFTLNHKQRWVRGGPWRTRREAEHAETRLRQRLEALGGREVIERRRLAPHSVYLLYGEDDELLYIGITMAGMDRIFKHARTKAWWTQVSRAEFRHLDTGDLAQAEETRLIDELRPRFNILKKRDIIPEGKADAEQVAERLRFKRASTILKFVAEGLLPIAGKTERGTAYFDLDEVEEWCLAGNAERATTRLPVISGQIGRSSYLESPDV